MPDWVKQRVLITIRTYPVPAKNGVEVSCTAGVTGEGRWIRLFPVPYRFLEEDKRFKKYQWIDVKTKRPRNDSRPESHSIDAASIIIGESISTDGGWKARRKILDPLHRPFCEIQTERDEHLYPTLGLTKPLRISKLLIEETSPNWSDADLARLSQLDLLAKTPANVLEKIPFVFKYQFMCTGKDCKGHLCTCTDWEMGQAYRRWRKDYGSNDWEKAFRQKFEAEMKEKLDTSFFVGNQHQYPNAWIIVGLFYPPKSPVSRAPPEPDLFG